MPASGSASTAAGDRVRAEGTSAVCLPPRQRLQQTRPPRDRAEGRGRGKKWTEMLVAVGRDSLLTRGCETAAFLPRSAPAVSAAGGVARKKPSGSVNAAHDLRWGGYARRRSVRPQKAAVVGSGVSTRRPHPHGKRPAATAPVGELPLTAAASTTARAGRAQVHKAAGTVHRLRAKSNEHSTTIRGPVNRPGRMVVRDVDRSLLAFGTSPPSVRSPDCRYRQQNEQAEQYPRQQNAEQRSAPPRLSGVFARRGAGDRWTGDRWARLRWPCNRHLECQREWCKMCRWVSLGDPTWLKRSKFDLEG